MEFYPGIGEAVARRSILRKGNKGAWETWDDVCHRVALGNCSLAHAAQHQVDEYNILKPLMSDGIVLTSGRHLQHGDVTQKYRALELYTNCLDGKTKFYTMEHGLVSLKDHVDETVTVKCIDGECRSATVRSYGKQKLNSVVLKSGQKVRKVISATANHRWFLENGTVTDRLKVGDILAKAVTKVDEEGMRHGIVFGDGTAHKRRVETKQNLVSQGRDYCSIRLCGEKANLVELFNTYSISYPEYAEGDPVVYVGRKQFWKEVPFSHDPSYVAGFIRGWWLADGSKVSKEDVYEISTSNPLAKKWLEEYAGLGGYTWMSTRVTHRKEGDGSFANGKDSYTIRMVKNRLWHVEAIIPNGEEEVYCVEEPVTKSFVLENGILTGNCSTAFNSFSLIYLLLNGSGVGRCYDDDMMLVDWDNMPTVVCAISATHPDYNKEVHTTTYEAKHQFSRTDKVTWVEIEDSREGWAKAIEYVEVMAFEKIHRDSLIILDFSKVRAKGTPIRGMQDRAASGPAPLMGALTKINNLKGAKMPLWMQAMYVDHLLADAVLFGGVRRSARMSTKTWRDKNVLDFIEVKRPVEFINKGLFEVIELRKSGLIGQPFLQTSNNSVTLDEDFWRLNDLKKRHKEYNTPLAEHARAVLAKLTQCAYGDGTGEPGTINVHKLVQNSTGLNQEMKFGIHLYPLNQDTQLYVNRLMAKAIQKPYYMITNPCGEIALAVWGGYCTIADVCPYHAKTLEEFIKACRAAVRFLIRTNTMPSYYSTEVKRTNRIGIGPTGLHEAAWKFFGFNFYDLIDEEKSMPFWLWLQEARLAIENEADTYSKLIGVESPHTLTTAKPSGTVSKLFGVTEGIHLPAKVYYLRWVMFPNNSPQVEEYRAKGYPVRTLNSYENTTIVGFPTKSAIADLMGDAVVTAGQATPEQQYQWLKLLEKYWIGPRGNQLSYTLKYDPTLVSYGDYVELFKKHQSQVRCCSIMPQEDVTLYEYQPEEPITKDKYLELMAIINNDGTLVEDVGREHVECEGGACPTNFKEDL